MSEISESAKTVPVVREVDVVVAGAGIAGTFAALGAAAGGARVLLVERFGALGGNMGPAMLVGGPLYEEVVITLPQRRPVGIPMRFIERLEQKMDGRPRNYATLSHAVSRTALEMMREAGVELMLSAYAADPVIEGDVVRGLYVETKSGRVAVRAKVVIDDTGDASIAERAGAPIIRGVDAATADSPNVGAQYKDPRYRTWNDGGLFFFLADTDIDAYRAFCKAPAALSAADEAWLASVNVRGVGNWPAPMAPILRRGWEAGEFRAWREVRERVFVAFNNWFAPIDPAARLAGGRAQAFGDYDSGNWEDISLLEAELRAQAFDGVAYFRGRVPGFEKSYIVAMSAFLGARGGPCIEGEHVLTPQESWAGARFPDVLYVTTVECHRGAAERGHDMPYGMLLPRGVEGLLVTGRGASFLRRGHDPSTRARVNMMTLGEATGRAAALAVRDGVPPRRIAIAKLQRELLAQGFYLGDDARRRELGLM